MTATCATWIHPFERADLGRAPFRFSGYGIESYQACPGAPVQPGATCDYCGSGIKHVYRVTDADGRQSKLGSECINKANDTEFSEAARIERRKFERAEQRKVWTAARKNRDDAERDANEARGLGRNTDRELRDAAQDGREAGRQWLRNEREAQRAASKHVGTVGKRAEFTLTIAHRIDFETQWGVTSIYIMTDADGNSLTWKTSGCFWCYSADGEHMCGRIGDVVTMKATVKAHDFYKGNAQTVLTRCKASAIDDTNRRDR